MSFAPAGAAAALAGGATQTAKAGGLNIGGGVDSADADTGKSNLGRVIGPKSIAALGVDIANQLFSPKLADGTLTGNQDFAGNLPGDKGFDNRDVQIKGAFNNAMDSRFVQQAGENLGLPKNFKAQTKDALAALGENYQGATADRDGIYKGTSETLKNLSSDKRLAPVAKYLNQLGTDNENVSDADRNKKFSVLGMKTPFTNETVADAITAFQPNVDKMTGLSTAERGLIEGGGGNRIISGKLTDIAREALTGSIGTGDSLGLAQGTPLSIGNMVDAGKMIASNYQKDGTLAQQRSAEIGNLANQAGKITTGSLIRGVNPFGGVKGSNRSRGLSTGSSGGAVFQSIDAIPEIPEIPVEKTGYVPQVLSQTGTNPNTLADIQNQSYQNTFNSLMAINPNYSAQFRLKPLNANRKGSFQRTFNRRYF